MTTGAKLRGTCTVWRYRVGVTPTHRVNSAEKLPRLEKPISMQTSVTGEPAASRSLARSSRARVRN